MGAAWSGSGILSVLRDLSQAKCCWAAPGSEVVVHVGRRLFL